MLIRISDAKVINIQQATGLYIAKTYKGYEIRCNMIDNEYVIEKCTTRQYAVAVLDKILSQYDRGQGKEDKKKCFKQEQEGKKMTEIPKERIQELLNFKKEYEDEPETEKCLEELLAYKETMAGIARMLGVTQYDITNKNEELLEVNLNNDVIKNALDRYRSFENTFLNKVTVMALKELLEYKETGLTPQDIKEMDNMYLEKCQQVNKLTCTCEMYERMAKK